MEVLDGAFNAGVTFDIIQPSKHLVVHSLYLRVYHNNRGVVKEFGVVERLVERTSEVLFKQVSVNNVDKDVLGGIDQLRPMLKEPDNLLDEFVLGQPRKGVGEIRIPEIVLVFLVRLRLSYRPFWRRDIH